jgi:hypothetical protein
MLRVTVVLCALVALGCSKTTYVIGRVGDAGDAGETTSDECAGSRASALVCSGFERVGLPDWGAPMIEQAGHIERSTTRAHSGEAALHASSTAMMSVAVVAADFSALQTGDVYVRVYAYVPASLPTETMNILFLGTAPSSAAFTGIDLNLQDGALQVYSSPSDPQRQTGSIPIPRDRWFCLRAHVALSADRGSVQAYIDDTLALDASGLDTLPDGGVTQFRAGIGWSSAQDAFFEIYFDDVVLDRTPVACD